MRAKSFILSVTALSCLLLFTACDKVKYPQFSNAPQGSVGATAVSDSMVGSLQRNIFIEDFTGHKCGHCPKAKDTIASIETIYPGRVISVVIHSGYWAVTNPVPYTYNFVVSDPNTPGYNELDNFFQVAAIGGNPSALINRIDYNISTNTHIKGLSDFKSAASVVASSGLSKVQISINTSTDTVANAIACDVKVKFLQGLSGNYKVAAMIIEDSIIKPQTDYRFNPHDILNFVHRHILRGYLYGAFGEQIGTNNPALNSVDSKSYSVSIPSNIINIKHCAIVAYVYDATTYEVLQAEQIHLIPH